MNPLFSILNADNTLSVNRLLIHSIGLEEAVFYQALLAKNEYYESRDMLDAEGFFYSTMEDMEESTALSRKTQDRIIKSLTESGLIFYCLKGIPAKRHFKINTDSSILTAILDKGKPVCKNSSPLIAQNEQTSLSKTDIQDCTDGSDKVVPNGQQNKREETKEKNESEKAKAVPIPAEKVLSALEMAKLMISNQELLAAMNDYIRMRKLQHQEITGSTAKRMIEKLMSNWSDNDQRLRVVYQATDRGYRDFYDCKDYSPSQSSHGKYSSAKMELCQHYDFDQLEKEIVAN